MNRDHLETPHDVDDLEQLNRRLAEENRYLRSEIEEENDCGGIVGRSDAIERVLTQIAQVATTDSTVLIEGETGVGKELVARTIHEQSRRRGRPMVKVNCGAITASLVESELFGHEKGAFTGASERRLGRFELADGGTLFLDEVGELPLDMQVKLLRALQEKEFERVGSSRPIQVDVRVIAAGNRDLAGDVAAGRFRADLYYRLNVFPIQVPPLRERIDDVPIIAACALPHLGRRVGKSIASLGPEASKHLMTYPWPGNVRELLNVVERAVILCQGDTVERQHLVLPEEPIGEASPGVPGDSGEAGDPLNPSELLPLAEVDRRHISRVLAHTDWVIEGPRGAARILEMHPNTLRSRMRKLGIQRPAHAG